ncbi:efflux RND transporter periplasmic adaptor subunit [Roseicella aerolata]|uniref:Efflux RND transporter periplasmic adaptor subunit n=1 Tax=Roseicella aerolata TaxID=2883479 RepID=A0A9X1IAI7_9PROT|nr:HlyD family efflux transporter periplasmic adaptor subunit [Roseicella aerolata]MCB4821256.1 efflux RND transporter periplasmic adaptor subunit [Roseicella aerolata]
MTATRRCLLLGAAALPLAARRAAAHAGHDHGEEDAAAPASAAPRVTASSEAFELVGLLGPDGALTLWLDRFADNAPVDGATILVGLDGQEIGEARRVAEAVYALRHEALARPGTHDLTFTVTAGGEMDLLAGTLAVPEPTAPAAAPHGLLETVREQPVLLGIGAGLLALGALLGRLAAPRPLPPMAEPEPAPARAPGAGEAPPLRRAAGPLRCLALLVLLAPGLALAQGMEAPRRLPDGSVFVPKPSQRLLGIRTVIAETGEATPTTRLVGRVVPDPNATGRVQPSQAGRIEPGEAGLPALGQRVEQGQVLAWVAPIYSAAERGQLQQGAAELDAQITIAEARVARLARLQGSVADREIQDARTELQGLRQRRAALNPVIAGREALRAPVAGVVSAVAAAVGQVVDARETVFEVVDPARLWVEAVAFDPATAFGPIAGATATGPAGERLALDFVGRGLALRQQAVPLNFRIAAPPAGLAVGAPVTVTVEAGARRVQGIVLPAAALVRPAEGAPVVFEHAAPERFIPRQVRTEPLDASRVLVAAGLEPGARVVVQAAGLVAQVR